MTLSELVRLALALEVDNDEDRKIVLAGIEHEFWDLPKDANTRLRNLILLENLAETVEIRSKLEAKNMASECSIKQKGFGGPSRSQMYDAILEVCLKENFAELKATQHQANNPLGIKACEEFEELIAANRIESAKQALLVG